MHAKSRKWGWPRLHLSTAVILFLLGSVALGAQFIKRQGAYTVHLSSKNVYLIKSVSGNKPIYETEGVLYPQSEFGFPFTLFISGVRHRDFDSDINVEVLYEYAWNYKAVVGNATVLLAALTVLTVLFERLYPSPERVRMNSSQAEPSRQRWPKIRLGALMILFLTTSIWLGIQFVPFKTDFGQSPFVNSVPASAWRVPTPDDGAISIESDLRRPVAHYGIPFRVATLWSHVVYDEKRYRWNVGGIAGNALTGFALLALIGFTLSKSLAKATSAGLS